MVCGHKLTKIMKLYSELIVDGNQLIATNFIINSPQSGFSFSIGGTNQNNIFSTGFSFSGYSGYLFDQSGNLFGGYYSGTQFDLNLHFFEQDKRISYFYDDVLMANNIYCKSNSLILDTIEFDKINNSTVNIANILENEAAFFYLKDNSGILLVSSDNKLLGTNIDI